MIVHATDTRKDFAADPRLLGIAAAAACVGVLSTVAAYALLQLIRLFTNIFFFHYWSTAPNSPAHNTLGREVMTRDVTTIDANTSIAEALDTHFGPHRVHRAFPIVSAGRFLGMADRAMLMKHVGSSGTARISDLFGENLPVMALPEETCRIVATRLAVHHLERLPVVKDADSRHLLGLSPAATSSSRHSHCSTKNTITSRSIKHHVVDYARRSGADEAGYNPPGHP